MPKLSIPVDDVLSRSVHRAASILGESTAEFGRISLNKRLALLRADPGFQAKRAAWLQDDDGLAPPVEEQIAQVREAGYARRTIEAQLTESIPDMDVPLGEET